MSDQAYSDQLSISAFKLAYQKPALHVIETGATQGDKPLVSTEGTFGFFGMLGPS